MTNTETPEYIRTRLTIDVDEALAYVKAELAKIIEAPVRSSRMVNYHYNDLLTLETEQKLWEQVVGRGGDEGWDYATQSAVGMIRDGSRSTSDLDNFETRIQREAALRWISTHKRMINPEILLWSF